LENNYNIFLPNDRQESYIPVQYNDIKEIPMKRFYVLSLLLVAVVLTVLVISACASTPSQAEEKTVKPESQPSIEIVNNTGYTFYYIHVSPSNSDAWGDDILGDNILEDGDSLTYLLPHLLSAVSEYDFAVEDEDEDLYFKFDITVTDNARIVFTLDDIYFEE
jgi:hypothetical protein